MRTTQLDLRPCAARAGEDAVLFRRLRRFGVSVTLVGLCLGLAFLSGCATRFSAAGDGALQTEEVTASPASSAGLPDIGKLQDSLELVRDMLHSNREGEIYSGAVEGTDPDDLAIAVTLVNGHV